MSFKFHIAAAFALGGLAGGLAAAVAQAAHVLHDPLIGRLAGHLQGFSRLLHGTPSPVGCSVNTVTRSGVRSFHGPDVLVTPGGR